MTNRSEPGRTPSDVEVVEFTVASTATRVTLFEDRAEVVRRAQVQVPAGVSWVRLTGVATMIDDPSVLPNLKGGSARVLATRVLRELRQVPAAPDEELLDSEADRKRAVTTRLAAEQALQTTEVHEQRCQSLMTAWIDALQRVPQAARTGLAGWRSAHQQLSEALATAQQQQLTARRTLDEARLDERRAQLRYEQARRLQPKQEALIELQIEAKAAADLQVEVTYRTPCALWRPEHVCRLLQGADGSSQLQVVTSAVVWQRTGEVWHNVQARFSTARPAQSAAPPLLTEDALRLRKKTDAEKRTVVVEARDQSIAVAGLARGESSVAEMPGMDDCGEPVLLQAPSPATLLSTGQPIRIEIGQVTLPCVVERVAFPERNQAAHLRATATLSGPRPLLAGPIHVVRNGELCGRGRIGYVGRGEPFEVGFGPDDGLRVRRQLTESREVTPVVGSQRITRTLKLFVSNLSGQQKQLTLSERIPVSEIRDVEVTLAQSSGMHFDPKDGFARFALDLPPRSTRELQLTYRIEASARVVLPAL